jgi:hypothetical protein
MGVNYFEGNGRVIVDILSRMCLNDMTKMTKTFRTASSDSRTQLGIRVHEQRTPYMDYNYINYLVPICFILNRHPQFLNIQRRYSIFYTCFKYIESIFVWVNMRKFLLNWNILKGFLLNCIVKIGKIINIRLFHNVSHISWLEQTNLYTMKTSRHTKVINPLNDISSVFKNYLTYAAHTMKQLWNNFNILTIQLCNKLLSKFYISKICAHINPHKDIL